MTSAWGTSWGSSWGNSWGSVSHGGGGKEREHSKLCVVSVDGQDYRVRFENLQAFLERLKEKQKEKRPKVIRRKRSKKAKVKLADRTKVVLKSAPPEYKAQIQASIDRSNEILRKIWEANITRLINEAEHEEAIAIILMMED